MIKLTSGGDAPQKQISFLVKQAFIKNESSWEDVLSSETLMSLTLGELIKGKKRLIIVAEIEGKIFYVVMSDNDYESVREKYPKAAVIHAGKLIMLAKKRINEEDYACSLPAIMTVIDVFPGTTIVDKTM